MRVHCAAYTHKTITRSVLKQQRSGIRKVRSAISTHVRSIINWIITAYDDT